MGGNGRRRVRSRGFTPGSSLFRKPRRGGGQEPGASAPGGPRSAEPPLSSQEPRRGDRGDSRPCGALPRGGAGTLSQGLPPLAIDHRPHSGAQIPLGTVATVTGVAADLGYGSYTHEPYPNPGGPKNAPYTRRAKAPGRRRGRSRNRPEGPNRRAAPATR